MKFTPPTRIQQRRGFATCVAALVLMCSISVFSTDYYVSSTGSDKAAGTAAKPWKTINRVNKGRYSAGDRILFEGGSAFSGSLNFTSASTGTAANPIFISSYGTGTATISSGSNAGISVYNAAGYYITNLNFVGAAGNSKIGISFYADLAGSVKLDTVHIDQVDV